MQRTPKYNQNQRVSIKKKNLAVLSVGKVQVIRKEQNLKKQGKIGMSENEVDDFFSVS